MVHGLLLSMRPAQWVKNLLVCAAPLAAGIILHADAALHTALAFVAFSLASSAVYCVNDVRDAEADRNHPAKCRRPVASGELSPRAAVIAAIALAAVALAVAAPNPLRLVIAVYLALSLAYSFGLKREPVIELAVVASGFLLRAIAGGPANGVPLSQWFLIVAGFGSLFVVAGKRLSEQSRFGAEVGRTRLVCTAYSSTYLRMVVGVSVAVTASAYGLWAFDVGASRTGLPWAAISIVPFVVALLRYMRDIDAGTAHEPEQVLLHDRTMQCLGALWLVSFSLSVLHG